MFSTAKVEALPPGLVRRPGGQVGHEREPCRAARAAEGDQPSYTVASAGTSFDVVRPAWVPQMGLASETRKRVRPGETRVRVVKRRVSSGRHRRRSQDCEGWDAQSAAEVALQAYVRRHDKRLADKVSSE